MKYLTKLLCIIGIHNFKIIQEGGIRGFANWVEIKRCVRCGKEVKS